MKKKKKTIMNDKGRRWTRKLMELVGQMINATQDEQFNSRE